MLTLHTTPRRDTVPGLLPLPKAPQLTQWQSHKGNTGVQLRKRPISDSLRALVTSVPGRHFRKSKGPGVEASLYACEPGPERQKSQKGRGESSAKVIPFANACVRV